MRIISTDISKIFAYKITLFLKVKACNGMLISMFLWKHMFPQKGNTHWNYTDEAHNQGLKWSLLYICGNSLKMKVPWYTMLHILVYSIEPGAEKIKIWHKRPAKTDTSMRISAGWIRPRLVLCRWAQIKAFILEVQWQLWWDRLSSWADTYPRAYAAVLNKRAWLN